MKEIYGFDALGQPVGIGDTVMTTGRGGCKAILPFVVVGVGARSLKVRPFDAKPGGSDGLLSRKFAEVVKASPKLVLEKFF